MLALFFLSFPSYSHIMGKSNWCLSNSPVHFECFYESEESCEKMKKMRLKTPGEFADWNCVNFPYEYSLKPESKIIEKR